MHLKQLFKKDISRPINGVVKADQVGNETVFVELDEYVITAELKGHIEQFFKYYMPSVDDPKKASETGKSGIWVSGFFGSGKSHFIKIMSYLLKNVETSNDGVTKRAIDFFEDKLAEDQMLLGDMRRAIQKENNVILFNIDSRADTDDKEDAILKVFLKVFNEKMGYSGDHAHIADLERDLDARGKLQEFHQAFEELSGSSWLEERDSYDFYRDDLAEAFAKVTGQSEEAGRQAIERLENNFSLDIQNFCKWVKQYLDGSPERRISFFVDEIGQYIGQNAQMMLKLQTITENLGTICEGRAWVVVTSQEDMDTVLGQMQQGSRKNDFSRIQQRFDRISLSSSNVNEVIEKRLLAKTEPAQTALTALYNEKGDIIRSQLSFEKTNKAEFSNFTGTNNFVSSYPFVPYQYNLIQKVFSGISQAGAAGTHLAKGERSLIEAFQTATNQFVSDEIGRLIPLYSFYPSIKKFLDTAVVRDINHAAEKSSISDFSVQVLQTLFMIRYVDEMKSTIDNIVTLCISEVDQDKRQLRIDITESLDALENNLLIARQGDEYIFLTNEEKEIEKEIQNTEIETSDETVELSKILFEEILRSSKTYRYPENKQDFPVSRYCNGQPFEKGSIDNDLHLKIVSPIDASYDDMTDAVCGNESKDAILIKLQDKARLFGELRTYIRTAKYTKRNAGRDADMELLIRAKAAENSARRKQIVSELEDAIKQSDFYLLGQSYKTKGATATAIIDNAYRQVIEDTFSKLKYVTPYSGDIRQQIQQTLIVDDLSQLNIDLSDVEANPRALFELEQHISISDEYGRPLTAGDLVKKFSRRPFGWNDYEIILMIARLAVANKITLQANQQDVPLRSAFEHLDKNSKRANLRIRRIQQQSEANLKKAAKLYKSVFHKNAPTTEKDLHEQALQLLKSMLAKLKDFKAKSTTGKFPGKNEIEDGIVSISSLVEQQGSYKFIDEFLRQGSDLEEFEEDYEELEVFYEKQFSTWQSLANALSIEFAKNRHLLKTSEVANSALEKLEAIYNDDRPYGKIRQVQGLIETVRAVNDEMLLARRNEVASKLEAAIDDVQQHVSEAKAPDTISNDALRPLQLSLKRLEHLTSIAEINEELRNSESLVEQAEEIINAFIDQQIKAAERQAALEAERRKQEAESSAGNDTKGSNGTLELEPNSSSGYGTSSATMDATKEPLKVAEPVVTKPKAKKVVTVKAGAVFQELGDTTYLETEEELENYLAALKTQLSDLIASNHRVRIK
ncbi:BREX system P-loop protein BrxC [Vibrio sp. Y42_MX_L11]|uniref:BREX system P-loop protein BrxC n=1 Tax=Vibrio sp. Y42_MX_L11 TaxID=2957765 RepID=UPI0020A2B6A0|nr:BREX system P-loop protein BrxC [Vibrio sp. Y42_MX_L11]